MNWLDFISRMTGSLAWPLAAITAAVLFRKKLSSWFAVPPSELGLSIGGQTFNAKWDRAAQGVEEKIEASYEEKIAGDSAGDTSDAHSGSPLSLRLRDLVRVSPRSAVSEAAVEVEEALRRRLKLAGTKNKRAMMSLMAAAREAYDQKIISGATFEALQGLSHLRNEVAHTRRNVEESRAWEYLAMCDAVLGIIGEGGQSRDSSQEEMR